MKEPTQEERRKAREHGMRYAPYPEWTEKEPLKGSLTAARADLAHSIADLLESLGEPFPWFRDALEAKAESMRERWAYELVDEGGE